MKRIIIGIVAGMFVIMMVIGCEGELDSSSQQDAASAASKLPDFEKLSSIKSIYGTGSIFRVRVSLSGSNEEYLVVHIVVYENKEGKTEVAYFDHKRPPNKIESRN
jgi:hypothetical protein